MNSPQGREPARPSSGTSANGATRPPAAQPRLSREAVVAFVLLPVLLAAGFFLGGRLLGGDADDVAPVDALTTTDGPEVSEDFIGPQPGGSGSDEPTDADAPENGLPPIGPVAPTEPGEVAPSADEPVEPAPTAEADAPSAPEPTEGAPEPTQPEPTQPEPTQPEATEPTQPEPTQPEPTQPEEAPAPPSEPAPAPGDAAPGDAASGPFAAGVPVPQAGADVLLFKGFAGPDVRTWQARMAERGWTILVDGIYGPQSASVATQFQQQKGLAVDGLVGPETWNAAWEAPIT